MLTLQEAIRERRSVRRFDDRRISEEIAKQLREEIEAVNRESGLHIQLVLDEPTAYAGMMSRYGGFSNVKNYLVMAGPKSPDLDERLGYYGERVVLLAQRLGLRSCWVGLTYSKRAAKKHFELADDEKSLLTVALGYGVLPQAPRKSKRPEDVAEADGPFPDWFLRGIESALLAPTAINQQKFRFALHDGEVTARALPGPYSKVDLGIAKYHFEAATGKRVG